MLYNPHISESAIAMSFSPEQRKLDIDCMAIFSGGVRSIGIIFDSSIRSIQGSTNFSDRNKADPAIANSF